jgi:hypothetical protein
VLVDSGHWESAYTTAYDAYRTAADAIVLALGYRVPAIAGAHRIATDVAHAALREHSHAFAPPTAEQFREGRHQSEYFDPDLPIDKTKDDAAWAVECAQAAIDAVGAALPSE